MTIINITDLENAKEDVDTISEFVESAAATLTTRGGQVVPTRSGITADLEASAASWNNTLFDNTTLGLAGTSSGDYFSVPSATESGYLDLYLNNAGVAELQKTNPSSEAIADVYEERLAASYAKSMEDKRLRRETLQKPRAAVVILLGQSNNAPRNTAISTTISSNAYMPVGGNALSYFDFYSTNAEHVVHWNDVASAAAHTEGASESPCSGVITGLMGGQFERIYACSGAIAARSLLVLGGAGPRANLYAVTHKLCDHARAAGFEPIVMFATHHGEAEMAAGNTEAEYYDRGWAYYRMAQMVAAQAMDRPDYDAPIVFRMPIVMSAAASSIGVFNAIRRLARDVPNAIGPMPTFQYDSESDRTHQTAIGFREKGEADGRALRDFFQKGDRHTPLEIVDVLRSGTSVTVTFNQEVTRDTNFDWGTLLNTSKALAGFEYDDAGTDIQVTVVTVQGHKTVLTLASAPVGAAASQYVQLAQQDTTAALAAGSASRSGTQMRSNVDSGFLSPYDYTYRHYAWGFPQRFAVRT